MKVNFDGLTKISKFSLRAVGLGRSDIIAVCLFYVCIGKCKYITEIHYVHKNVPNTYNFSYFFIRFIVYNITIKC